jgi:hypothetical protein
LFISNYSEHDIHFSKRNSEITWSKIEADKWKYNNEFYALLLLLKSYNIFRVLNGAVCGRFSFRPSVKKSFFVSFCSDAGHAKWPPPAVWGPERLSGSYLAIVQSCRGAKDGNLSKTTRNVAVISTRNFATFVTCARCMNWWDCIHRKRQKKKNLKAGTKKMVVAFLYGVRLCNTLVSGLLSWRTPLRLTKYSTVLLFQKLVFLWQCTSLH